MTRKFRKSAILARSGGEGVQRSQDTQKALRISGALQSAIFNSSNFSCIATDAKGVIQLFNVGAERMLGHAAAEVLNTFTPADLSDPEEMIERAAALSLELGTAIAPGFDALVYKSSRGIEDIYELTYIRKDGSRFPAMVSVTALHDAHRAIIGYLLIGTDNTARKLAEETICKISTAVEQSPVSVVITDTHGCIEYVNPFFLETTGYSLAEVMGQNSRILKSEILPSEDYKGLWNKLMAGNTWRGEIHNRKKNGDIFWEQASISPIRNAHGTVTSFVAVKEDITERKQVEEELSQVNERLHRVHALEALGVLVAGVAHNINNVLAVIMGTASMHEGLGTEAADREAYATIGTACLRGRSVIKSLLQFAQPVLSRPTPLELHSVIREVHKLMESTTRNRIKIVERFAREPLWIIGDVASINHALMNLCINSLGAMPGGGTLTLGTEVLADNWVEVSVADSGSGMTPEVLAHVMEPFFTTREVGQGTGLGLSMTYGVVISHGGTIDIASQPGQGTLVQIRFPRIAAPAQSEPVQPPEPCLGPMRVVLVDDDEDVRLLMTRMLKQAGVRQVQTFAGGEELLETLGSGELPDLIILDQNMPGLNGAQTMERIRDLHPDVAILMASGQPDIEDWECFKRPNVGTIPKPFNLQEIRAKLAQFAGSANASHLSPMTTQT